MPLLPSHGTQSMLDEAVMKNMDACKQLSTITRTSLGMNKKVINHLDKLFVTNDATTIVNELEVELLRGSEELINKAIQVLDELVEKDREQVVSRMTAAVATNQYGQEDILCPLVANACIQVCPKNPMNFNVDNVRVAKLVGGGLFNCSIVIGMVLKHDSVGSIKKMEKAKMEMEVAEEDKNGEGRRCTAVYVKQKEDQ